MTLGERIKKLRKSFDLTQREFGERIGVKPNTIATYEIGRNEPIDAVVSLICREFNVNEVWLRTGDGEMSVPKEADALDELVKQYGLSDGDYVLIEKFLKLKPAERQAVISYMKDVVSALNAGKDIPVHASPVSESPAPDIAAEIVELKRQNQELTAKVAAMEEEDAKMEAAAELSAWPSVSAGSLNQTERAKK